MEFFSVVFSLANLILIPTYCLLRFRNNKFIVFLNPCFYLLIGSYFYLTVSSVFIQSYIRFNSLFEYNLGLLVFTRYSSSLIATVNLLSNWTVLVFLGFYSISKDRIFAFEKFVPKLKTYRIATIFAAVISVILLLLLLIYGPTLFSLNRKASLSFLGENLLAKYRLTVLTNVLLASIAVIVWRTQKFRWYLLLALPIGFALLSRGRTLALSTVVFAYINYVAITKKTRIASITIVVTSIVSLGVIRFGAFYLDRMNSLGNKILYILYGFLGEVLHTQLTSILVYDQFLNYGNLGEYLLKSSFNVLPSSITSRLFSDFSIYTNPLRDYYSDLGISYGLAGNILSEALFYGGVPFAIISPFIIGIIFYLLTVLKVTRTFPGFIFVSFLLANLQRFLRSSFYDNFVILLYVMFSYLLWLTVMEWNRVVFRKVKKVVYPFHQDYSSSQISK